MTPPMDEVERIARLIHEAFRATMLLAENQASSPWDSLSSVVRYRYLAAARAVIADEDRKRAELDAALPDPEPTNFVGTACYVAGVLERLATDHVDRPGCSKFAGLVLLEVHRLRMAQRALVAAFDKTFGPTTGETK